MEAGYGQAALELAQSRSASSSRADGKCPLLLPRSLARSKDDDPTGMWTLRHAIMQSSSLAR